MEKAGVDQLLESCVKSYVSHCAKQHSIFNENQIHITDEKDALKKMNLIINGIRILKKFYRSRKKRIKTKMCYEKC